MADSTPNLLGCREKVRRAGEHFEAIDKAMFDWLGEPGVDATPWTMHGEFRPQDEVFAFFGELLKEPDEVLRWGVMLGDALHNVRSALDHLVWQLVLLNGQQPTRANQFPICDSEKEYLGDGGKRKGKQQACLQGVKPEHVKLIDERQPYLEPLELGKKLHPLSVLRDLSNEDKHQVIHLTDIAVDFPDEAAIDALLIPNKDAGRRIASKPGKLVYGEETIVFAAFYECGGPNPDVRATGLPPLSIGMSNLRMRFTGLTFLGGLVTQILDAFEPSFG